MKSSLRDKSDVSSKTTFWRNVSSEIIFLFFSKAGMSLNTIYIAVDGNDATAQYGSPLFPFTLQGAIARINSIPKTNYWYLHIANGSYTVPCGSSLVFGVNVIVTGAGPRNTILNVSNIQIINGVEATFSSINFRSCDNTPLFSLVSGTLILNNDEINISTGTAFALTNGMAFVNGSVFNVTGATTNPIINVGQGGLMATNSNFNYKLNGANLAPNTSHRAQSRHGNAYSH